MHVFGTHRARLRMEAGDTPLLRMLNGAFLSYRLRPGPGGAAMMLRPYVKSHIQLGLITSC